MQEKTEKLSDDHTFKPTINENPQFSKEKNFELRILENLKKKQENLIKLQTENTDKFTFHPKINRKSQEIILNSQKTLDNSFSFKGSSKEIPKENNWTFQPKILNNTKYQVDGEFFDRIQQKNRQKQENIMKIAKEIYCDNVTFRPKINRISSLLTEEDPSRKKMDSVERLYTNVINKYETMFNFFDKAEFQKRDKK